MAITGGFDEYHDSHLAGARRVAKFAREMAETSGLRLDHVRWHRGHEVANLDSYYLTLIAGNRAVSHLVPNEWLGRVAKGGANEEIPALLGDMLSKLAR